MTIRVFALGLVAAVSLSLATPASAGSITFSNETLDGGSGWGNVLGILGLQQPPQSTSETGEVRWNGGPNSALVGDATNQSTTRTVTELIAKGIVESDTEFGLVFNINDTGSNANVTMAALELRFFDATGSTLFTAPYVCAACAYPFPLLLNESAQGLGNSGFLFRAALTSSERATFFGTVTNRVGLYASVNNTDNGPEQFYLADIQRSTEQPLTSTPEPGSMILLGSGLAALAFRRYRSRRA